MASEAFSKPHNNEAQLMSELNAANNIIIEQKVRIVLLRVALLDCAGQIRVILEALDPLSLATVTRESLRKALEVLEETKP